MFTDSTTEYRIGHNPAPSTPMSTSGILINSQFPAQGSGLVTSWNYCYYTDSLSFSNNYSATFAVWRNDSMSSSVTMVTDSFLTVTLQCQNTIASIYCLVVELEPEDHFILKEGDYVGVALPMTNSIPLLGVSSDYTLWSSPDSSIDMSLLLDSLAQTTGALHLYAVIGMESISILVFKLIIVHFNNYYNCYVPMCMASFFILCLYSNA